MCIRDSGCSECNENIGIYGPRARFLRGLGFELLTSHSAKWPSVKQWGRLCGVWLFCPFAGLPLSLFSPGSFAPWLVHPLACLPSGWSAPWLFCPMACSPPGSFARSPWIFHPHRIPVIWRRGLYVIIVFRPRQFMHDDENKLLCDFLMLCSILK